MDDGDGDDDDGDEGDDGDSDGDGDGQRALENARAREGVIGFVSFRFGSEEARRRVEWSG